MEKDIYTTGNTVIDAMGATVDSSYTFETPDLNEIDFKNKKVVMITAHRRENWGEPLENICKALKKLAEQHEDIEIVYLVHLNPVVKETAYGILGNVARVHLLPPLDTRETHNLMDRSYMILTDSGGLQEEAPHLGKPVLVLRDVTERPEAVEAGTVKVVGTDMNRIYDEASKLINSKSEYEKMANSVNPYGDGLASKRIVDSILYYFEKRDERPEDFKPSKHQ